jgi:hypothetical protein
MFNLSPFRHIKILTAGLNMNWLTNN